MRTIFSLIAALAIWLIAPGFNNSTALNTMKPIPANADPEKHLLEYLLSSLVSLPKNGRPLSASFRLL